MREVTEFFLCDSIECHTGLPLAVHAAEERYAKSCQWTAIAYSRTGLLHSFIASMQWREDIEYLTLVDVHVV